MSDEILVNILEDLSGDEFKRFKWHLKKEEVSGMQPIQESKLEKADRDDVVDLMVKKYEVAGAVKVTRSVLKKISRNDLVTKLEREAPGAAGPGPGGALSPPAEDKVPDDERLFSVRDKFVKRVSGPVLNQLLDKLLQREVITDEEMQSVTAKATKAEKARVMIDTVQSKGEEASSELIAALRQVDKYLSKQLNLI